MMQLTNYIRFQADETEYLFHGLTGTIMAIDDEVKQFIDYLEENGEKKYDSISFCETKLEHMEGHFKRIKNEMLEMEILTVIDSEEGKSFSKTPPPPIVTEEMPIKTLVMHLVNECNLRCVYCYADGGEYGAPQKYMSPLVAKQAVDFLMKNSFDEPLVNIVLFGGEPFLNWEVLQTIVEYSAEQSKKVGKKVHYSLTTNGTILTKKQAEFLNRYSVGVSVSMDGTEEAHNKNRPYEGGQGSYEQVSKNLAKLMDVHHSAPIGTRVTVASGFESLETSLHHLLSKGFYEVGFAPVTESDMALALDNDELNNLLNQFKELTDIYVQHAAENEYFGFSNLTNLLKELHIGTNKAYGCGAGLGFFAVSPDGGLYLCHRFNEDERFKLGDIYQGVHRERQQELLNELHVDNKAPCQSCALKHICAGGCYYEALERQGDYRSPNAHYCEWMHEWITTGLSAYVRILSRNPEFLEQIA